MGVKWELGAGCKAQDRSPRRKKGEAFLERTVTLLIVTIPVN